MELRKAWRGKEWIAEYGEGYSVTAPTKSEARDAAYASMERMVSGSYTPRVLVYGTLGAIIYRTPGGWAYSLLGQGGADETGRVSTGGWCMSDWKDADDVERDVRRHLAQIATDPRDPASDHRRVILDETDRAEYARWLAWQRACCAAMDAGHDMETARAIADRARYAA